MLANIILFIFFACVVACVLLKYTIFDYWRKRNVPFVKPNYIFGNVWDIISLRKPLSIFVHDIHMNYSKERYIGIFNMFQPALVIRDGEIIKNILIKDFDHFQDNWYEVDPKVDPILARNPFVLKHKEWKHARPLLTSQFTSAKIKSMVPVLTEVCNKMTQYILTESATKKSTCFELNDLSSRFTGESAMNCAYSIETSSFSKPTPDIFLINATSSGLPTVLITLKRTLGLMFRFFSRLFKVTFNGDPIPRLFANIIESAIANRIENNIARNDYLDHILELKNQRKITESDVTGFAHSFFNDAFETSYGALSYALLELCLNPTVQYSARQEVETVLQKYNGKLTFEAYQELNYLERVLYETLRKHSIIKVMSKVCTKPYVIQDSDTENGITIEKGVTAFFSLSAMHHNPEYYPEPEIFDPERFTEAVKKTRPNISFLGFGDGPRICLGRRFAMAQIIFALAKLLLEFDLKINKKTTFPIKQDTFHIANTPVSGLYVDFIPRSTKNSSTINSY